MSTKLYPPQLAGSLPAFCKTYDILQDLSTGARITIPFVMNAGVGEAEVKGFALRIKTVSSNTYLCPVLYSSDWDREKSTVTFEIKAEYANAFNEGQFYKVQLAYYNYKTEAVLNPTTGKYEETIMDVVNSDNFVIGYYSTVGIVKCISKPTIYIEGYSSSSVNLFNGSFLGVYDQGDNFDKTEKVYSYRFDFYDMDDNIVQTSGELIHNINNDSNNSYSIDRYICNDFIKPTETYKLVYTVTTMNGYVGSSPRYKVTANTRLAPGRYMEIIPTPIIADGCIDVSCKGELGLNPEGKMDEALYYGEFLLSRASEEDGFVEWEQIQEFRLSNQKPSTFHFYDFSIKQGVKYIYAVQQFNMSKLYSTRMQSQPVSIDFEDMFLFDGERSLRIRFNPKVSSFKTTHLEKKVETIGGKYPFIFRNGAVGYKEFPVEGLISYHMDENKNFFKREELYNFYRQNEETRNKALKQKYIEHHRDTDLTEDNILLERQFKIAVLDWLNNGEPKLFKSATEGNYIVRLINVSLSPEDILGRMLHTFKATAVEIADCNLTNLKKYGFSIGGSINSYVPLWRTYDFNSLDRSSDGRGKILKFEQEVTSFKIEGALPRTKVYIYYSDSSTPEEIIIGATGFYSFSGSSRRVVKLLFIFENDLNIQGQIECEYMGRRYSNFDAITDIKLQTILSNQVIGVNPKMRYMKNSNEKIKNWTLAADALGDTNYRTYFNKYLIHPQVSEYLKNNTSITGGYQNENNDWIDLLIRLNILAEQEEEDGSKKLVTVENSLFDPSDTIQYIQTDFYDGERNKLTILNMESAKLRQRELVPIYVVPYEMITPEAWKKIPDNVSGKNKVKGEDYYTREDYEDESFLTTNLLFSTTPFGKPYPIDDLITYLTLQVNNYEPAIDKYCIFQIYKYNYIKQEWEPIKNKSHVVPIFSGCYYDAHHKELLQNYETSFYINDIFRYEPLHKADIIKYNNKYNVWKADGQTIITNNILYIKENGTYIPAKDKFNYQDQYSFWIDSKEPDIYYLQYNNNIDLKYSKEMTFEQLGEVKKFGISNGIISEQTFQLQITDFYTEINDLPTRLAKEKYLEESQFLKDVFKMFHNIEQADIKQTKYKSLYKLYEIFLKGGESVNFEINKYPLNAYDFLTLYIMLEKKFIEVEILEKYFLKRLVGVGLPEKKDIEDNLKRLITDYSGTEGVPIEILLKEMFVTENDTIKDDYANKQNIYTAIYNQLGKYDELKLIDNEESDLLSLLTDNEIIGLDSKNQSLKRLYDSIAADIDKKKQNMQKLANDFSDAQNNLQLQYEYYNNNIAQTAAVEWLKRLVELNTPKNEEDLKKFKLLDLLTTIEQVYTEEANNMNVESQYQQDQINKWKNYYKNIYETSNNLIAENIVLEKIQKDNNEDPDLDSYLQSSIVENLKEIVILRAQMETIEKTKYNDEIPILTEEDLLNYSGKALDIQDINLYEVEVCENLIIKKLDKLIQELDDAELEDIDIIKEDNTEIIALIQEFVLEADNHQLFKEYKNFGENIVFNIPGDYTALRKKYIDKLPATAILTLKRNILKINSEGQNTLEGKIEKNKEEEYYLFSKDRESEFYNIKEYKIRLKFLLDVIRNTIECIDVDPNDVNAIISTGKYKGFQINSFASYIGSRELDMINKAIDRVNKIIIEYVDLLHNSKLITPQKWDELLQEFNEKYPFDSYVPNEPDANYIFSNMDYQSKINNAKLLTATTISIIYAEEPSMDMQLIETTNGSELEYKFRGQVIYTPEKKATKYTYTYAYRYFSDFYQKLIGNIVDITDAEADNSGMLWWYIKVVLQGEIAYQMSVLKDMEKLLSEYEIKLDNYNEKLNRYKEEYTNAEKIYLQYEQEYNKVFKYYKSNSGNQYKLIDEAIMRTKKYWNLFILELDLGYKREVERGMYG